MKTYQRAPLYVAQAAQALIGVHYPDIENHGVTIEFLYARNDNGDPVSHQGYRALAVCRIVNLKDRAKGCKDAEITIDAEAFEDMDDPQRDALLDHELNHLIVAKDEDGEVKLDGAGRPVLNIRKHDYQLGWFTSIAKRHGMASVEVTAARILWAKDGQAFFPMLMGGGNTETETLGDRFKAAGDDIARRTGLEVVVDGSPGLMSKAVPKSKKKS